MILRDYQYAAVSAVRAALDTHDSTLIVMPTGCGKTVVFGHVVHQHQQQRALVIAHREELVFQAANKIKAITGAEPGMEMAEYRASAGVFGEEQCVVASIQTLNAGRGDGRMARFDFAKFGMIVIDEAHHATAASFRRVINYARKQNPAIKILGVTATPDRTDKSALGQVFDNVAYTYGIIDAINDGYLVPIHSRAVIVESLDLSAVRTKAGDLNGADLARAMMYELPLHKVADPLYELAGERKTLVFAASIAHAERLTEILNRHRPNCAQWVHGDTPKEVRRQMFSDYADNRFQFLLNVGVATEGFDDPGIEVVAMARPTKSRSLFTQMAGRGTRVLPGTIDASGETLFDGGGWTADERKARIAASAKPYMEILDFVGNSGKHKLITAADILGGNYSDEVTDRARENARADGTPKDVLAALKDAAVAINEEREAAKAEAAAKRAAIRPKANYSTATIDPFNVFAMEPHRETSWEKGKQPSSKMLDVLERSGVKTESLSYGEASQILDEIKNRRTNHLCTYKQAKLLQRYGFDTSTMTVKQASAEIESIKAAGWKRPRHTASGTGITRY